ncbi:Serine aminopeptidase, S33 [Sphingomonas guangdongensis]|uniref:Serine aminopeptidase, S33 n=1 Tax=Sphingomonas guangdongensis TaxID=1141890 RepID=A0A285Q9X8_9SPHN|nr:Serine aminopeptidase, S33 [Sphingomonas guangdongensis]
MKPPPLSLLLTEWPRAAGTVARLARDWRGLADQPRGDGHRVMVLPGLFNSDRSNVVLRRHLDRLGYRALGWGLGRNLGARTIGADARRLIARIEAAAVDGPVTLIGVSLGGIMARLVAHRRPELVRGVITISSPFAASPRATHVWRAFEWVTGERVDDPVIAARLAEVMAPLPMPATAIWGRHDGLVASTACRTDACDALEVPSGHLGVQLHPAVLRGVGEILAQRLSSEAR